MESPSGKLLRLKPAAAATNTETGIDTSIAGRGWTDELSLIQALRRGDEAAFLTLIEQFHTSMIRLAKNYVSSYEVAEEVVQETWIGVLRGLNRFEQLSSLKTWIFRILTNQAKTRAQLEAHSITFSDILLFHGNENEPAVDPDCFGADGWWKSHPNDWGNCLEEHILGQEVYNYIQQTVQNLPPDQATVLTLRDIEGWTAAEVCEVLALSEDNQRVLLHRARAKVRNTLEEYVDRKKVIKRKS